MLQPNSTMSAIFIRLKREFYQPAMNCTVKVLAPPNYGLMALITKIKMRRFGHGVSDSLDFSSQSHTLLKLFGMNEEIIPKKTILTKIDESQLNINFVSVHNYFSLPGKGFKIVVNLYTGTVVYLRKIMK